MRRQEVSEKIKAEQMEFCEKYLTGGIDRGSRHSVSYVVKVKGSNGGTD